MLFVHKFVVYETFNFWELRRREINTEMHLCQVHLKNVRDVYACNNDKKYTLVLLCFFLSTSGWCIFCEILLTGIESLKETNQMFSIDIFGEREQLQLWPSAALESRLIFSNNISATLANIDLGTPVRVNDTKFSWYFW